MRTIGACLLTMVTFVHCSQFASENKKIVLKANFGGGPISDFLGEDQVMEMEGFAKNIARVKIANTDQPEIFLSNRFGRGTDMTFRIPVPTGVYALTLLFAETYTPACVPGGRVFDISLGTPSSGVSKIVEGFDVFQAAGCLSAYGKRFDRVPSKDGIVVHLARKTQHPAVCGFIVEGFPLPRGDGSEYKTVGRDAEQEPVLGDVNANGAGEAAPGPGGLAPGGAVPGAPIPGAPIPGAPIPGAPIPGAPIPGAPIPGAPIPGAPVPGAPVPGAPVPGAPVPGAPVPGASVPGAPVLGAPVAAPAAPGPDAPAPPGMVPVGMNAMGGAPPQMPAPGAPPFRRVQRRLA